MKKTKKKLYTETTLEEGIEDIKNEKEILKKENKELKKQIKSLNRFFNDKLTDDDFRICDKWVEGKYDEEIISIDTTYSLLNGEEISNLITDILNLKYQKNNYKRFSLKTENDEYLIVDILDELHFPPFNNWKEAGLIVKFLNNNCIHTTYK